MCFRPKQSVTPATHVSMALVLTQGVMVQPTRVAVMKDTQALNVVSEQKILDQLCKQCRKLFLARIIQIRAIRWELHWGGLFSRWKSVTYLVVQQRFPFYTFLYILCPLGPYQDSKIKLHLFTIPKYFLIMHKWIQCSDSSRYRTVNAWTITMKLIIS